MKKKAIVFDVEWVIFSHNLTIADTLEFIKNNSEKYIFFTNTSMSKMKLQRMFSDFDIWKYFMELLAYDDWGKKENIDYIMSVYSLDREVILFIDDGEHNIEAVKPTWIHTLLFVQDGVSLKEKINSIFK